MAAPGTPCTNGLRPASVKHEADLVGRLEEDRVADEHHRRTLCEVDRRAVVTASRQVAVMRAKVKATPAIPRKPSLYLTPRRAVTSGSPGMCPLPHQHLRMGRSGRMDAITLLKNDHKDVEALFKRFEKAGDRGVHREAGHRRPHHRGAVEARRRSRSSSSTRCPGPRSPDTEDIVLESMEEHHVVKWLLSELEDMDPRHERFDAKTTVLIENVRHHVEEEEEEFFPKVRDELGRNALNELGDAMEQARARSPRPTRTPARRTPLRATSSLGAAAGAVDRVTDTVSGVAQGSMAVLQDVIARVTGAKKRTPSPKGTPTARRARQPDPGPGRRGHRPHRRRRSARPAAPVRTRSTTPVAQWPTPSGRRTSAPPASARPPPRRRPASAPAPPRGRRAAPAPTAKKATRKATGRRPRRRDRGPVRPPTRASRTAKATTKKAATRTRSTAKKASSRTRTTAKKAHEAGRRARPGRRRHARRDRLGPPSDPLPTPSTSRRSGSGSTSSARRSRT